jgi:cellulose synthase/poly-beta-1,6-N-acetylglucosamine synthase-like glycosyltransferase
MISIILTAYKEPNTIGRAIEAFIKQKIKDKYELLVLAPDKETSDIIKKYAKKHKQVKYLKDPGKGKPVALNIAFKKAKGNILVLSDGDVYVSKNSVNELAERFKDQKVGAVTGRPVSINSRKDMLGFWSHLLCDIADKIRKQRVEEQKMIVCSGYLYAIRAGIVDKIPEDALSDDAVISHLIYDEGYSTVYSSRAEVYVKYPTNFSDWIKQKKRSAGGYNQLNAMVKGKERMRSFTKESSGIFSVLRYPKSLKELFYTKMLILARVYLWILIFWDINIKKKEFSKVWVRIESTK